MDCDSVSDITHGFSISFTDLITIDMNFNSVSFSSAKSYKFDEVRHSCHVKKITCYSACPPFAFLQRWSSPRLSLKVLTEIFIFGSGQIRNKIYVLQHVKNQRLENTKYANKFKDWYTGLTRAVVKWYREFPVVFATGI